MLRGLAALVVAASLLTPSAGAAPAEQAPADAAIRCRVLKPTDSLRRTLRRVHVRTVRRANPRTRVTGPIGRVYYGRCGRTAYALATFAHRTPNVNFGTQDQPEQFRRPAGRAWRDLGDTGGVVCETAPRPLLRRWRLARSC